MSDVIHMSETDSSTLRRALGNFITGVTVVATMDKGVPVGRTVNSFTSVSLDPPLILVCLHRDSLLLSQISAFGAFSVNILSSGQSHVSNAFSSKSRSQFAGIDHSLGPLGTPAITSSLACLECRLHQSLEGGDHVILLGRAETVLTSEEASPLSFFRGTVNPVDPTIPSQRGK